MPDVVRVKLTEALREQHAMSYDGDAAMYWCDCGKAAGDYRDWADHMVDVLLSLEGVAIVALPEPDDTGSGQGGEFDAWWGRYPDNDPHHAPRWDGHDVWAEHGEVHTSAIHEHTPDQARALAAVLLAAADAAEAVTDA